MNKLFALSTAAVLALTPAIASAESPLFLNSTKSTGNAAAGFEEPIVVADAPTSGLTGLVVGGLGLILVAAALSGGDSDDAAATTGDGDGNDND